MLQKNIKRRTVALSVNATKLTDRTLARQHSGGYKRIIRRTNHAGQTERKRADEPWCLYKQY